MIEFGAMCFLVLCLTAWDREAVPWAVILLLGWIAGFLPVETWSAISALICISTGFLFFLRPRKWKAAVHAIAVVMLLLDGWFLYSARLGNYVGIEYAFALSAGLVLQLILVGHRGAWNALVGLLGWGGSYLRRGNVLAFGSSRRDGKAAAE